MKCNLLRSYLFVVDLSGLLDDSLGDRLALLCHNNLNIAGGLVEVYKSKYYIIR